MSRLWPAQAIMKCCHLLFTLFVKCHGEMLTSHVQGLFYGAFYQTSQHFGLRPTVLPVFKFICFMFFFQKSLVDKLLIQKFTRIRRLVQPIYSQNFPQLRNIYHWGRRWSGFVMLFRGNYQWSFFRNSINKYLQYTFCTFSTCSKSMYSDISKFSSIPAK